MLLRHTVATSLFVALLAALAWRALRVAPPPPPPPPPPLPPFFRTADGLALLQAAELRSFDDQIIYLAIIGDVFDVTTGRRHAASA